MANTPNLDLKKMESDPKATNFNHKEYYENNFEKVDAAMGAAPSTLTTTAKTIIPAINELKSDKVDKETGKGLSTNDFDNTYKQKIDIDIPAQLAEKVQNFKIKNEVVNGDFSNGITGWSSLSNMSLDTTTFGFDTLYANLTNQPSSFSKDIPALTTDKLYVFANYYLVSHITGALRLTVRDFGAASNATIFALNLSKIGQWQLISGIVSGKINGIRLIENGLTATASYHVSKIGVVNLTSIFGTGNEPTKLEMDELMKVIPNGWWDGELSLTQKQFITWQLNLNRKNTNAIIALGGTIV